METSTDEEPAPLLLFTAPLLFPGATVGAGAPLSKVKLLCSEEVEEVEVEAEEGAEDNGRVGDVPDGDKVFVGEREGVDETPVLAKGVLAGVPDEEAPGGKTATPVEGAVELGPPVTVTVVVTVTVGSPLVPMAVWIEAGSAKVLVDVAETKGDVEMVEDEAVVGNGLPVDGETARGEASVVDSGVEVLAGTVTKVILLN